MFEIQIFETKTLTGQPLLFRILMPPSKVQIPSPDREGGDKNKHFVHRFTLLTQASILVIRI